MMALKPCQGCGKDVDATASMCPHCGRAKPTATALDKFGNLALSIAAAVVGIVVVSRSCGGSESRSGSNDIRDGSEARSMSDVINDNLNRQVLRDVAKQYEIAKRSGSKMDACVQAGLVSAALLQAKDEENFRKWKDVERQDCKLAGAPIEK